MLFLALLLPQPPQDTPTTDLGTTVVTPTLSPEDAFAAPYATSVVDQAELDAKGYRTLPQALRNIPGILVQETALGHGSPYIRGFTGFRTLARPVGTSGIARQKRRRLRTAARAQPIPAALTALASFMAPLILTVPEFGF